MEKDERSGPAGGNLTMRQLEVFAMASRCSTFSEAAKRLGISQPSLSTTIAKMESQLGISLFDRTSRTLALTPQGRRLAAVADELVRNFQASLVDIHAKAADQRGRLSIAVVPSVASSIAPQALGAFFEDYPAFDVGLHDVTGDKAVAWVLDRVVDCAIVARPSNTQDLRIETLHRDRFELVCRKDHPLATKRSVSWKDIDGTSLILAGTGSIHNDIEKAWMRDGADIRPRFKIEQIMTGLSMVSNGLGVTIVPGLCRPSGAFPDLVSVRLGSIRIEREIVIVRRPDRAVSEPVQHLIGCFKRALGELPSRG